jgi:hypothetical protein
MGVQAAPQLTPIPEPYVIVTPICVDCGHIIAIRVGLDEVIKPPVNDFMKEIGWGLDPDRCASCYRDYQKQFFKPEERRTL